MKLSLADTATVLGKTERQVRYLIKRGELKAEKKKGRWSIDSDDLPLSANQRQQLARRVDAAREQVDAALGPAAKASGAEDDGKSERYSVQKLAAFDVGRQLYRNAHATFGDEHPATRELFGALVQLTCGCHAFQPGEKAEAFRLARRRAATATAHLFVIEQEKGDELAQRVEQELIPKIGGLVAAQEKDRRSSSRFERFGSGRR